MCEMCMVVCPHCGGEPESLPYCPVCCGLGEVTLLARDNFVGGAGPVRFAREVLGVEPTAWQADLLRAHGRGEPDA